MHGERLACEQTTLLQFLMGLWNILKMIKIMIVKTVIEIKIKMKKINTSVPVAPVPLEPPTPSFRADSGGSQADDQRCRHRPDHVDLEPNKLTISEVTNITATILIILIWN